MSKNNEYDLQIVIASGIENPCRAQLSFQTALAAMASELNVVVFLSTSGVLWGLNHGVLSEVGCGTGAIRRDIRQMTDMLLESDVRIEICSNCIGDHCPVPSNGGEPPEACLIEGIVPGGLASVAIRAAAVNTVTF